MTNDEPKTATGNKASAVNRSGTAGEAATVADKKRILVVDDEPSITRLLRLNLEQTNDYVVRGENDAQRALAAAEEFHPDLILLDVMMPAMDGGELASRFQANPRLKKVPIIFLTAAATRKEIREHGGRIGGLPFLAKPVDLNEVLTCLKRNLSRQPV